MVNKNVDQCPERDLHYVDEKFVNQCWAWCAGHKSCYLEFTKHSNMTKASSGQKPL